MTTFKIPEENLEALRRTIARLAKTATRLGCTGISFRETGDTEMVEVQAETGRYFRKVCVVEIEGAAPKLPGWSFLAAVQPSETEDCRYAAGHTRLNIIHVFGDVPEGTLDAYRSCDLRCDHCRVNRRRVKAYIVLREEDGHVAMVGSDCLAHYTGHENPEDVARAAEMLAMILAAASEGEGDEWGGGGRRISHLGLEDFLFATAAQIRARGWVSRSRAHDEMVVATADAVLEGMVGLPHNREAWCESVSGVQQADIEVAQAALAWARDTQPRTDYDWNIWTLAQGETVAIKHIGLAASIVAVYLKHVDAEITRRAAAAQSKHIGTVGKRETFTLIFEGSRTIEGPYGSTYVLRFTEGAGNAVVWFSSNGPVTLGLTAGCAYKVTASVKKHEDYKGVQTTSITRGKVVSVGAAA